jgi:anti-sigma factor RsiW
MSGRSTNRGWSEEMLLAYVDNELDPRQAAALEAAIRGDPEAQAMLALLRRSAAAVRTAFDAPLLEPVPPRLLAALERPAGRSGGRSRPAFPLGRALLPLAASLLALFVGFAGGFLYRDREATVVPAAAVGDPGEERFASALREALEAVDAGAPVTYEVPETGARGSVTILGPAEAGLGVPCRTFRHEAIRGDVASLSLGLACREPSGAWSVLTIAKPAS